MTNPNTPAPAHEAVLTTGQILALERRSNMTDDEALRFGRAIESALLSKLRAPVADDRKQDGKRPDLDWIEGVQVTDTVGRGWCVRIDGTDIYDDVNRYGCKGRRSFQIAAGLPSKQEAERAAVEWLDHQRAALASAPAVDEWALAVALRVIAEYPTPGEGSMSAANMREIARAALASAPISGKCPPAPPAPPSLPYREVESGVIKPHRNMASAPVAGEALNDLQALQWAEKHGLQWVIGPPDTIREVIADAQRLAAPQASEAVRDAGIAAPEQERT